MLKLETVVLSFATILVALASTSVVSAQQTIFFSDSQACLAAQPTTFTIYQPRFHEKLGWWQEKVELGKAELVQDRKVRCAEEWTVEGWRIVRWPDGNPFFRSADGKLADGRCGNGVRQIWEVPEPAPAPPPTPVPAVVPKCCEEPSPVRTPEPIPTAKPFCVVNGNSKDGFVGTAYNGKGRWVVRREGEKGFQIIEGNTFKPYVDLGPGTYIADYDVQGDGGKANCRRTWEVEAPPEVIAEAVTPEKRHHKFPIPCIPREKGWYGIGVPMVECAAIAFGAYGIHEALEGGVALLKSGALVKLAPLIP